MRPILIMDIWHPDLDEKQREYLMLKDGIQEERDEYAQQYDDAMSTGQSWFNSSEGLTRAHVDDFVHSTTEFDTKELWLIDLPLYNTILRTLYESNLLNAKPYDLLLTRLLLAN